MAEAVAVVIPARNEQERIAACVRSVHLSASRAALRADVLVVDDESSDATASVAAAEGARVLRQPSRQGPYAAWLAGVGATTADWIVFVDGDCRLRPDAMGRLLEARRSEVGVLCARAVTGQVRGRGGVVLRSARFSSLLLHETKSRLRDHAFLPIGRLLGVHRSLWGGADDGRWGPCDVLVGQRAQSLGLEVLYVPSAVVEYDPVGSYGELVSDYCRTRLAPAMLSGRPSVPCRVAARGAASAARQAPVDAAAWLATRAALAAGRVTGRVRVPSLPPAAWGEPASRSAAP